jgi:hypothetical protein
MQDLAQAALPLHFELAGGCDSCLDKVGESATRRLLVAAASILGSTGVQLFKALRGGLFTKAESLFDVHG